MRPLWLSASMVALVLVGACSAGTPAPPAAAPSTPVQTSMTAPTSASPAVVVATDLVGSWHRAQSCEEILAVFKSAGLAESHADWLTGNFFGGSPAPTGADPCQGSPGPLEHAHFFTADGQFGSRDENGRQVDDGDYRPVDAGTLAFPSHATEFGYAADLVVGYAIQDGVLMFDVKLPTPCDGPCKDAYAWALSALASGPWARGDIP